MKILIILLLLSFGNNILQTEAYPRQCVTNAERNEKGECVCNSGYHGRGDLCCMPTDHKICMIMGDPVIDTMNGDVLPLDVPCLTEISEVHTWGDKYDETVHALMAGEYGKDGTLLMSFLRLEYEERYHEIHTLIEIYYSDIIINGEKVDKSKPWASEEYELTMRYNETVDTYIMVSTGRTIIHFVPPSNSTEEQNSMAGVCVAVKRKAVLHDTGLCNQRKRSLQRSIFNKGFSHLRAGVIDYIIRVQPTSMIMVPSTVQKKCKAIKSSRRSCRNSWNPAIAACFAIIGHTDIRYCLDKNRLDVLDVFQECMKAQCGMGFSSCSFIKSQEVKECINVQPDCSNLYH